MDNSPAPKPFGLWTALRVRELPTLELTRRPWIIFFREKKLTTASFANRIFFQKYHLKTRLTS